MTNDLGPYNCIGKPLALLNMRNTLSRLILNFDFEFAPGHSRTEFEDKMKDRFVLYPGDLYLTFSKRV